MVRMSGKVLMLSLGVLVSCLLSAAGLYEKAETERQERLDAGRMTNVLLLEEAAPSPLPLPVSTEQPAEPKPVELPTEPEITPEILVTVLQSAPEQEILETTIPGSQLLKNDTAYDIDPEAILSEGPGLRLPAEGPQILIMHTHGSEAYTPAGLDRYDASDSNRTQDPRYSVIRVGDELAERLEEQGLRVLHDREIYDYPSYTGSYSRSGEAVSRYLERYPEIAVVIDLHRDALGADGVVYKTMAEEEGTVASQVMLLVGSDESGLEHPNWRENLSLALYLQQAAATAHPTLMRPVSLVPQRYNQQLTGGSLILEVGCSGNTLQEALAAVRLFAGAAGPALLALAEAPGEN